MPILDSSFLVDLARGQEAAQVALHAMTSSEEPMLVPFQAAAEYLAGFEDPIAALHDLRTGFSLVPPNEDHLLEIARLARDSLAGGTFPGWPDVHIAATATLEGEEVVTADVRHFRALGCRVWDYREEVRHPGGEE